MTYIYDGKDPWLTNLATAMQYNPSTGEPELRVNVGASTITITGDVTIPGSIEVNNDTGNPLPISANTTANGSGNPLYVNFTNGTIGVTQSTSPWVVSGSVNIGTMPEVEIKNDSGNPVPVSGTVTANQGTNPWVVSGSLTTTPSGIQQVSFDQSATDAFGRLRVSDPYTIFDTNSRYYDHGQFDTATANGGSFAYEADSSVFRLSVTTTSGSSVLRQTKRVFPYQPGKSLLVLNSFCFNTPIAGLTQRVGFYGSQNGIYFEAAGTTYNMVIRSYSSGVLVEDRIPQSAWNGDRLDGTGGSHNPSGIRLYPDRVQIFYTDIEWLGVGSVRCGFIINGQYYTCHTFHHANVVGNNTTYMTTATLPISFEIFTTTAQPLPSTMRQICSSVISEGGYNSYGTTQLAGVGITPKRLTTAGTYYPVVSIRMATSRIDSIIVPRQIDILSPTVNYYRWVLLQNASLTGATWANTSATGTVEYDLAATAVSGGQEIQSGYVSSRELSELGAVDFFQYQLGRTIAGVSDTVTLALTATSNNADVLAQLGWQELT